MIDIPVPADLDIEVSGKGIDDRGTDAMQAAGGLIYRVIELAAGMQGGKNDPLGGDALLVHFHRDAAAVVLHSAGAVRLQGDRNPAAVPGQVLIHGIVHNLVNQVVQALLGHTSYIHARPLADRVQALEDRN